MDQNLLRGILAALGLVCFLAIVVWAYSGGAKSRFAEAERLPFDEGEFDAPRKDQQS